jgi:hypothetical protein
MNNKKRPEAFERLKHQLTLLKKNHPNYDDLMRLYEQLSRQPVRNGFRNHTNLQTKTNQKNAARAIAWQKL